MNEKIPTLKESYSKSVPDLEEANFDEISRERSELRKAKNKSELGVTEILAEELEELNKKAVKFSISGEGGLSKAKTRLKIDKDKFEKKKETTVRTIPVDDKAIGLELGETYDILSEAVEKLENVRDFEMNQLRDNVSSAIYSNVQGRVITRIRLKKADLQKNISKIEADNPLEFRAFSLIQYKKGLHREGHIASVPSVQEHRRQIGTRMISGKPMFIHGPTGTGKTSIARNSAEHFTGHKAEMVYCNPQTRESNIWGKTGLRPAEGEAGKHGAIETVDVFGPLARAAKEGKVVIFDEFTALPKEQQIMIKGIFNAKPGDTVNIMGNGVIAIKPGFQMIFTANLKSEKNPERQDLPPEIAREFEQNNLEVNYTSPEESYDIILARLMNSDGSIDLSYHDLNVTLPQFTKAMAEIQTAYTDKESEETARLTQTLDSSNKRPGLKKLVLTQGTIENIIDAWKIEKQTNHNYPSFAEFLDSRLKTALTFKEYPETDRILAAKILASKGFLRTLVPRDLDLPDNIFSFDAANRLRQDPKAIQDLRGQSAQESHVSLTEISQLDPFNKKQKEMAQAASQFLPEEEQADGQQDQGQDILANKNFLKETFKQWGVNSQKILESEPNMMAEIISPNNLDWEKRKQDIDASRFGEYTLNPDTQNLSFDRIKIKVEKLPDNLNGKPIAEIAEYITSTYSNRYYIPGLEFWKYILENPSQAPDSLKDGNYHFFFGSVLRSSYGHWSVPYASWAGSGFYCNALWLSHDWYSSFRVVLLEK